jgi:hypothetical protein
MHPRDEIIWRTPGGRRPVSWDELLEGASFVIVEGMVGCVDGTWMAGKD